MNVPSNPSSALADAVSDSIGALSVLAYPELHARVVEELSPERIARHAADSARRLLQAASLLRRTSGAHELGWIIDAEPVAEALSNEIGTGAGATSPPPADLVRLARELLRHLLIASGFGEGAAGWDRDRDTIPPLEAWTDPGDAPGS